MVSPSISSTRRSTPCAAGCCGPKFKVRLRISATAASRRARGGGGVRRPRDSGWDDRRGGPSGIRSRIDRPWHTATVLQRQVVQRWIVAIVVADHARHEDTRFDAHGLVNHALELRVVAHLDVADERKVLAEGMTDETIVGQDAT